MGAVFDAWSLVTGIPHMLGTLPWVPMLVSGVIGMMLGAQLRWPGVFTVLSLGVAMFFVFKEKAADTHEHVAGKDAAPVVKKPRVRRDSIAKRLGIGE